MEDYPRNSANMTAPRRTNTAHRDQKALLYSEYQRFIEYNNQVLTNCSGNDLENYGISIYIEKHYQLTIFDIIGLAPNARLCPERGTHVILRKVGNVRPEDGSIQVKIREGSYKMNDYRDFLLQEIWGVVTESIEKKLKNRWLTVVIQKRGEEHRIPIVFNQRKHIWYLLYMVNELMDNVEAVMNA